MKKLIILFLILISINVSSRINIFADSSSKQNQLESNVEQVIDNLDLSEYENILNNLDEQEKSIFNGGNFLQIVKSLINGELTLNFSSVISLIFSLFFVQLKLVMPTLIIVCILAILSNLLNQSKSSNSSKSIGSIVHFACFAIIVTLIFNVVSGLITCSSNVISSLKNQMEITFPILLTLMTSIGSTVSVGVYQPLVAVLSGGLLSFFQVIVLPLFIFSIVFNVVGNLSNDVKLNKFCGLFNSIFKTLIGIVFTIFMAFLTIQGISAGSYDGISFKTAKFAIKSYVPFLGGYLSDGLSLIITSSVLVKNAVGFGGLLVLFSTIISPIINILVVKFGLNFASSIIEPIADKKVSDFMSGVAKSLNMLIATVLAISFAYLITVGLFMCSSNLLF